MTKFLIHGGKRLNGEVKIGGSKNAALPILAATLLTDQPCVIKNVPDIKDTHTMLAILCSLGAKFEFKNHTVKIQTKKISPNSPSVQLCCKMRASVLLLGPLLARRGFAHLPYPGGCVLGARPIDTHIDVLKKMKVEQLKSAQDEIIFRGKPRAGHIVMWEFSVTATENAIMAASRTLGETHIHLAAVEPHVRDLCNALELMGVDINGIGTHTLRIRGKRKLRGITYSIAPDYLEAGTFVIAGVLTRGHIIVKNIAPHDLDPLWNLLHEIGVKFELSKNAAKIVPQEHWKACKRLQTMIYPGFPTDLQPPFAILLTQAHGESKIHEALFEGRFRYFPDLVKMGAKIQQVNPHEALVKGPTVLRGSEVNSWDIRAGAAMILAGLIARGKTIVKNIQYIDRGYERFDEKLRSLGADIVRLD